MGSRPVRQVTEVPSPPNSRDIYGTWDENMARATDEADGLPDRAIVPYVEALRAAGVVTFQSCAGHRQEQDDGTVEGSDGVLWFQAYLSRDALGFLVAAPAISHVRRLYKPEDCWEIFADLRAAMMLLFAALEIQLPPP